MKKQIVATLAVLSITSLTTWVAFAAKPTGPSTGGGNVQIIGTPTVIDGTTTLCTTAKLAGLGNGDVTITVTGTGNPTVTCTSPGGNLAPDQNPGEITSTGSQTIPQEQLKNGTVTFSVCTEEPADPSGKGGGCPNNNFDAQITEVDFTSATLTVVQGGKTVIQQPLATP